MNISTHERFMRHVHHEPNTGCWLWGGANDNRMGYGNFYMSGSMVGAHRVSWMLHGGQDLNGLFVLHRCDNPPCVNPAHLFLGTQQENVDDRVQKGRSSAREAHPHARLTEQDILDIRTRYMMGDSQVRIAKDFGVSSPHVSRIARNIKWTQR